MSAKTQERLEAEAKKLRERLAQIKARKQEIQARERSAEAKRARKDDTRRKILAGALLLSVMNQDDATKAKFTALIDKALTRDDDRALFGLDPRPADTPA